MTRRVGSLLWVILAMGAGGCVATSAMPPAVVEPSPESTRAVVPPSPESKPAVVGRAPESTPAPRAPRPVTMTGRASWYGDFHQGRLTANGEIFDKNALTAAHRTLPFGTRLRVVNLENDREVEVRINDRGPVVPGRVLDLSYAAAPALGAVGSGVIPVRMTVLSGD
jgi:rare lipoprotein A